MKQIIAPVISSSEVMPGVYLLWLEAPEIASAAKPGQFVMAYCGEDTYLRRPLSIHQVDHKTKAGLALLFAVKGKGTQWLSQRQAGDNIDLLGPLGNGFSLSPESQKLLLVAGGIGLAPLCFLAQEAASKGHSVNLLMGAANANQIYSGHFFPPEVEIFTTTEDGSAGRKGMITDLVPDFVDWADRVYACGPVAMYRAMTELPELRGKPVQVSLEVRMACGLGYCYGCTVKTKSGLKQVCEDGPVFNLEDILWDELSC